jgi:exosome complex component MTR3
VGREIWLDPTEEESLASSGSLVLACMPALGTVISVWQSGRMSTREAIDVSQSACIQRIY